MATAPPTHDLNERARALAATRYGTPLAQLHQERQAGNTAYNAYINAGNQWRDTGKAGINESFDILDTNLGQNYTNAQGDLANALQANQDVWDRTNQETGIIRDEQLGYFNDLAERIGVPQAAAGSSQLGNVSRIQQMAQQAIENNSRYGATAQTGFQNQGNMHLQMLNRGQQYAQGDRANRLASFDQEIANMLLKLAGQKLDRDYDYGNQNMNLLNEQGAFEASTLADLHDKSYEQMNMYDKQLLAEAELAQRASIAQAELDARADSTRASSQPNPLDMLKYQLELDKFEQGNWEFDQTHGLNQDKFGLDRDRFGLEGWKAGGESVESPGGYGAFQSELNGLVQGGQIAPAQASWLQQEVINAIHKTDPTLGSGGWMSHLAGSLAKDKRYDPAMMMAVSALHEKGLRPRYGYGGGGGY